MSRSHDRREQGAGGPRLNSWRPAAVIFAGPGLPLREYLILGIPLVALGALTLHLVAPAQRLRWGLQALAAVLIVELRVRPLLRRYRLPAGVSLGPPNRVTLWRGGLAALAAGFIALPLSPSAADGAIWLWLPGTLYLGVALLDVFDGWLARRLGLQSELGARLDSEIDALGLACAALLLVAGGRAPAAYLLVGAAYYLWQALSAWRLRRGLNVVAVRPWNGARLLAGFQMGFAAAALLPVLSPAVTRAATWLFMLPFLAGLLRDALISFECIASDAAQRCRAERVLWPMLERWLLPALRLALLPLAWAQSGGMSMPGWLLLGCVAAGVLGRLAAGCFGVLWALRFSAAALDAPATALLLGALAVMLAGSGFFSLWQPEERWLRRRTGRRAKIHEAG